MDSAQYAWAVGLYEGEGYAGIYGGYSRLGIEMTDKDAIERFAEVFPGGNLRSRQRGCWKRTYEYRISKKSIVQKTLAQMLPLLCNRRAHKALDILDQIECN